MMLSAIFYTRANFFTTLDVSKHQPELNTNATSVADLRNLFKQVTPESLLALEQKAAEGSDSDKDAAKLFTLIYNTDQAIERADDVFLAKVMSDILDYRYDTSRAGTSAVVQLAKSAADLLAEKRDTDGQFYSSDQVDAVYVLAMVTADHNRADAARYYHMAEKGYAQMGSIGKSEDAAFYARRYEAKLAGNKPSAP